MTFKKAGIGVGIVVLVLGIVMAISKLYYNQEIISEKINIVEIKNNQNTTDLQEKINLANVKINIGVDNVETQINLVNLDIEELYKLSIFTNQTIGKLAATQEELGRSLEILAKKTTSAILIAQEKNRILLLKEKLKKVNVTILNKTHEGLGSATIIKYKGKYYLLSAAHLLAGDKNSVMYFEERYDSPIGNLKIVKIDEKNDLVLFAPINEEIIPQVYVELASFEPPTGEEIYVVGNPCGFYDVLTKGIIMLYEEMYCVFIGNSYFGNSGGGVFNDRGEVIGVMSVIGQIEAIKGVPPFKMDGAIRLNEIIAFMKDVE